MLGNDSGLMIFDAQGTLISGIGKTYPMDLLVQDPRSLSDAIATMQRTIDDDELYIYCTRNPEMNWIYVYAQNTQGFSSRLYEIRNWILVIFLGVVTIGILYAWFVSKQLYHPINDHIADRDTMQAAFFRLLRRNFPHHYQIPPSSSIFLASLLVMMTSIRLSTPSKRPTAAE